MKISVESIYTWYRDIIRNPKYRWWIILGSLLYVLSPIDIAPDFIPIAGQVDDIVILTLLVSEISQLLIEQVKSRKVGQSTTVATSSNETNTNNNQDTVDVKAVSLE
jgi:uncharacterized membrane protein YkvA (DUF1232 family)